MSIDLTLPPDQVAAEIVAIATEHRNPWIEETARNHRRLAGFTENDVPTATTEIDGTTMGEAEPASHRYATTFNVTRNFFYRLLGRIMPVMTRFHVLSATRDRDDRDTAKMGARYLRSRTSPDSGQDFEAVTRAVSYLFAGGPVYLRVEPYWADKQSDVDVAPVIGFDVYPYPGIMDINESPAIVLEERLTRLVIERRYPKLTEGIDWNAVPGSKWPDDVEFDALSPKIDQGCHTIRRLIIRPTMSDVCDAKMGKDGVMRRAAPAPEGREFIMIVGHPGKFERRDTIGTPDKLYPLVQISDIPMGPFFEDRGRMTISSRMQRTIDICVSKTLDVVVGGPQVVVGLPTGGRLTQDMFTNQAWVFYDKVPGQEPSIQEVGGLTNLMSVIQLAMQFMGEVHAQSPASRGQSEGERQSGKALEQMSAMDSAVDEPFLAMIRRALARFGKRVLMVAKQIMEVVGEAFPFVEMSKNQRYQMRSLMASNLTDNFTVRVHPGSGMPENKAARMQLVIKGLGQISLFSDHPDAVRARELLEMSIDDEEHFEFQDEEEQVIRAEDALILREEKPQVSVSDNHNLHRVRHKQALMRYRSEFGSLPPEIEEVYRVHDREHVGLMQAEVVAQMPPQAFDQGGGATLPAAS